MKKIVSFGLFLLALAATGVCAAEIPNLVGSWTGVGPGYVEGAGYVDGADSDNLTFNITEQNGRLFTGEMTYMVEGMDVVEGFAGAIAVDNKTFYVTEYFSGYDVGTVISEDEIELIYLQDGEPAEVYVQTLRRMAE
ncbi:MAG TPA: hypothetical protein PLQ49_01930 [Methanothrix sp.]|nr:hypothetical protein [Methanothrix sp.]